MRVLVPWIISPNHSVSGSSGGGGGMVTDPEAPSGLMVVTSWCQWGPPPSLIHPSHILVLVSRSHSFAPFAPYPPPPSPSLPSPAVPGGSGEGGKGGNGGGVALFAKPASPLSLLSLLSFLYLFLIPTPFIGARTCTPPPPRRSLSRRNQHLAQKLLNPKVPQLRQRRRRRRDGEDDMFGVRRWWWRECCAKEGRTEEETVSWSYKDFLDEFRCLRLKLDRIRYLILN